MVLQVIGFGVGRTGTFSTKLALEALGYGPCHHMEELHITSPAEVAVWSDAAAGRVDWNAAYTGYQSAVDWPTAAFSTELVAAFPDAKYLLTVRDPEAWYRSFSKTIAPLVDAAAETPPELRPFTAMVRAVMHKTGIDIPNSREALLAAYERHVAHVRGLIPPDRLLVFNVAEGWEPLCRFLGVPVPETPYPRTNDTQAFWAGVPEHVARPSLA